MNGFVNSKDVNGNQKVNWSWAPTDIGRATLESMFHCGELVIHHKEGIRKYYGLTADLLPVSMTNKPDPNKTADDYYEWYVRRRIGAVGLLWNRSGDAWLGSHMGKKERSKAIKGLLEREEIIEVTIAGINEVFYMPRMESGKLEDKKKYREASIIAPLDNLIWDRRLISHIFDFSYKWEVYTPVKERKFGYYILPVIYDGKFIGRFEPIRVRKNRELVIKNWWWEKNININQDLIDALIRCFAEFVKFLDVETILISDTVAESKLTWLQNCV